MNGTFTDESNALPNKTCAHCTHSSLCAAKVPIFQGLDHAELAKIVGLTGHTEYAKGEMIVHEGDRSDTLFIINEGMVKLSKINRDGREQILRLIRDGEFFGELNIFGSGQELNFSACAVTPVKICSLRKERMDAILNENPGIATKLLAEVSRRLAETENLAQTLSAHDAESSVAFVLLELAATQGEETGEGLIVRPSLNREELAAYAGLTRESFSRKLSSFEAAGLIRLNKGREILILEYEELKNIL